MQRYAGLQIVSLIVASSNPDQFFKENASHIQHNVLANRFGVSHMHVRRLFTDAVAAGLLHGLGRGDYALSLPMRDTIGFFYALQLAELVASARATIEGFAPTEGI